MQPFVKLKDRALKKYMNKHLAFSKKNINCIT